jgi:hypothetical protein
VEDALKLFVEGEVLDGDNSVFCTRCARKQPTLKRTALDARDGLPPTLFLHLKRFDFDLETFRKVKVNDRCAFPRALDLTPFTLAHVDTQDDDESSGGSSGGSSSSSSGDSGVAAAQAAYRSGGSGGSAMVDDEAAEAAAPACALYDLAGVIVHSGTADCGHYYSYIRQRSPLADSSSPSSSPSSSTSSSTSTSSGGECGPPAEGPWFCFNDTSVTAFDPAALEAQCFGGCEQAARWSAAAGRSQGGSYPKAYSAYMLVYEQRRPPPPAVPSGPARASLPPHASAVAARCRAENRALRHDQQIFDPRCERTGCWFCRLKLSRLTNASLCSCVF